MQQGVSYHCGEEGSISYQIDQQNNRHILELKKSQQLDFSMSRRVQSGSGSIK